MRTTLLVALASVLTVAAVGASWFLPQPPQAPVLPAPAAHPAATEPDPFVVDCRGSGFRESATLDLVADVGFASPEAAVAGMLGPGESASAPEVEGDEARIALHRPDGSTRTVVGLDRVAHGWLPVTLDGCPGESVRPR